MGNVRRSGFTLIEVLLVMAILMILLVIMAATINPFAMIGKGWDARRKKDLGRIKVAFEEYMNDKGCYPDQDRVDGLMETANCGSEVFEPWLNSWPCDPKGQPYFLVIDNGNPTCPRWYKILTNLENQKDPGIPAGWYDYGNAYHVGNGAYGINDVNYGVSSTNVNWYDYVLDPSCHWYANNHAFDECYLRSAGGGGCAGASDNSCSGLNCYARNDCHLTDICKVSCCGAACN